MDFKESKRKFKGVWINREIWFDHKRPIMERFFMIEIDYLDNDEEKGCYASNKYFSQFFGVSPERCSQIINKLQKEGFLKIDYIREGKEIKERNIHLTEEGIKYIKGGTKPVLKIDNYSNNNQPLSNDKEGFENPPKNSKKTEIPKPITDKFLLKIINEFNKDSNGPKCKIDKMYKYHYTILKYIKGLKSGTFVDYIELSFEFMNRNNITKKVLNKKWSEEEIIEGVRELKLLFKEGRWPEDKTKLPTNLAYLFYNPGRFSNKIERSGGSSFFLMSYLNGVKLLRKESTIKRTRAHIAARTRTEEETKDVDLPESDDIETMAKWHEEQKNKRRKAI